MRTTRALAMLALVAAAGATACADSTASTTSEPTTTTSAAPATSSGTTAGQSYRHLLDGDAITLDDLNRDLAITLGNRAELHLSRDYTWTDPLVAGPAELTAITPPDDAGYVAWELVTSGPGNLIISATGVPNCDGDDCNLDDLDFAISIVVRRP